MWLQMNATFLRPSVRFQEEILKPQPTCCEICTWQRNIPTKRKKIKKNPSVSYSNKWHALNSATSDYEKVSCDGPLTAHFAQQTQTPGGHSKPLVCKLLVFESPVSVIFPPEGALGVFCCSVALEGNAVGVDASTELALVAMVANAPEGVTPTWSGVCSPFCETHGKNPGGHCLTS